MKKRKCKECKEWFTPSPFMFLPPTCEKMDCRISYADKHLAKKKKAVEKKDKAVITEARVALREFKKNDKPVLLQLAQKIFNQYIRVRDNDLPCISCGYDFKNYTTDQPRQAHASHYRPATNSFLRFDERNVWRSCQICNTHLSGNLANYRLALIEKIGLDQVEELEATNGVKKITVEELQEIITTYRQKIKDIV